LLLILLAIGDTFEVGEAIIQISEPRLPCYKLGIRFETQKVVKEFMNSSFSGAYVRVLKEGIVKPDNKLKLIEKRDNIKLSELYSLFSTEKENQALIKKALDEPFLAEEFKKDIRRKLL